MAVSTERVPLYVLHSTVPDPDLEIREGGWGGAVTQTLG